MVAQALEGAFEQHAVVDADGQAPGFCDSKQVLGVSRRGAHGLFKEDADARLKRGLRDFVMEIRGYEHVHDVEALLGQHRLQRGVRRHAPASRERFHRSRIDVADRRQFDAMGGPDRSSVEIRYVARANNCGTDGTSNREISCVQE